MISNNDNMLQETRTFKQLVLPPPSTSSGNFRPLYAFRQRRVEPAISKKALFQKDGQDKSYTMSLMEIDHVLAAMALRNVPALWQFSDTGIIYHRKSELEKARLAIVGQPTIPKPSSISFNMPGFN